MKSRILLVEDESILRMDVKEILEEAGYDVVGEAGDGEKAIELTYMLKPDLIIMDIKMSKMNGLKASKIISKSYRTPILFLTAYSQKDFVENAKQPNVMGYLVKPISENNLLPAVEIVLSQANYRNNRYEEIEALHQKLEGRKIIERAKGLLMKKNGLQEDEAYEKIRKWSMNKRDTMENISQEILESTTDYS